ncbi:MAG TPA: matrixin family metalloprotease [Methyloprofundus sp.]|nr:matrixin family metalloprotease [Methyloprofundus sp.]
MSQVSVSNDERIDALLTTFKWGSVIGESAQLSFSFPVPGSSWVSDYQGGEPFAPNTLSFLNAAQRQGVRENLLLWSHVANITFTEVDDLVTQGDLRFTHSSAVDNTDGVAAWAYVPPITSTVPESGDVWFSQESVSDVSLGSHGFFVLMHEIGHALGLKHPFSQQSQNVVTLPVAEDTTQYTVMSNTGYSGVGWSRKGEIDLFSRVNNTTPMPYDILAIQYLYGANSSFNTGNDIYTFSNDIADFKTIWDAGGTDTFDLSNQTKTVVIDLNAGAFSSVGPMNYELVSGLIESSTKLAVNNIAIAFGVDIENVIGGSGGDHLTGNDLANDLTGMSGNDILIGGEGTDTALYLGNKSDYQITTLTTGLQVTSLNTDEGVDTLLGIERLQFVDQLIDTATFSVIPTTTAEVDITPFERDVNHINYFLLQINRALAIDVSADYTTVEGTAKAGEDYLTALGTATIVAGETSTVVGVEIIGDNIHEIDETFFLAISNPTGLSFPVGVTEITASRTIIDDDLEVSSHLSDIQIIGLESIVPV